MFQQERYPGKGCIPQDGFVPDSVTAIKIAEAVLTPVYGSRVLNQRPFKVSLAENKVWIVDGTLHSSRNKNGFVLGGTAHVEIRKKTEQYLK